MAKEAQSERVLMLVKALPHVSENYGETVCCAGVTLARQWRRQFPIAFRQLGDDKFYRWDWVEYDYRFPGKTDLRAESRRVQEGTLKTIGRMKKAERAGFLSPLIVGSTDAAKLKNQTLALIRPINPKFSWKKKSPDIISREADAYKRAADQLSFFSESQEALVPTPYEFRYDYETPDGRKRTSTCGDWEVSATFFKWKKKYGEDKALEFMAKTYGDDYPKRGVVFAMGTHSRYPDTWLLVGVIRLDEAKQIQMF